MTDKPKADYYAGPQAGDFAGAAGALRAVRGLVRRRRCARAQRSQRHGARHRRCRGHAQRAHGAAQGPRSGRARRRAASSSTPTSRAPRAASCWQPARRRCASTGSRCAGRCACAGTYRWSSDAEADAYFATRPRGSRLGAWASQQSRPLESRFALEKAVAAVDGHAIRIGEIPRPPYWSGFRVTPVEMEFWHDRPFRLHERVVFRREGPDGAWRKERLYP